MSEEMNNLEKTTRDDFSEEIRKALAAPDSKKPTLEEFKLMVYKDREKRRKKRNAAVAGIVVALMAGFFAFDTLVPEVGADKNPKEEIITEDGVIIEDGGYGSSVGEENVWVTEDWGNLEDAKLLYPNLLIPSYIPKGYVFKNLNIERAETNALVGKYCFVNAKSESIEIDIYLHDGGEASTNISNIDKKVVCDKGIIYLHSNKEKATIQMDDGIVIIWGDLLDEEIIKLVNNLEY